ncbi:MAG: o-succinylbenzoate synthase [Balneolales bacterium]|nr:o-succinylbenzoate synthase [Balneolales bacterium]
MPLEITPYRTLFSKPLQTATGVINEREGLYLSFDSDGVVVRGETAPLPGFSKESISQVKQLLEVHHGDIFEYLSFVSEHILVLDANNSELSTYIGDILSKYTTRSVLPNLVPSLYFAIDSIIFQMGIHHWYKLSGSRFTFRKVPLNALVSDAESMNSAYYDGFRTFKLKNSLAIHSDAEKIEYIRNRFQDVSIRLDANGAWDYDTAQRALILFKPGNIEYIEQPLDTSSLVTRGSSLKAFGIPIAADESIRSLADFMTLIQHESCDVVIIKPMMLNGLSEFLEICKMADTHGIKVVVTSSLDTGLARRMYALLASIFLKETHAHGLATGSFLAQDAYPDETLISNGFYTPQLPM